MYNLKNQFLKIQHLKNKKNVFKNAIQIDNFKDKIFKNACININKKSNRNFTTSLSLKNG